MRFFESQRLAKRNTIFLVVLFFFNVTLISFLNAILAIVVSASPGFAAIVFVASVLTLIGCAYYYMNTLSAGDRVASLLGGEMLGTEQNGPHEKRLLNVVEEMAIASGVAVPRVYLLKGEPSINAFAAGVDPNRAVIAVTQGALNHLNREELQGVIAHEFSHILNEDLLLNSRLVGAVLGFQIFMKIGTEIMFPGRRSRAKEAFSLFVIGGVLCAFGAMGYFLGRALQSLISAQREYLADASSAQFTRNPESLARALAKIRKGSSKSGTSVIQNKNRHELAHIFFADAIFEDRSLFSTHPPIEDRIQKLVPRVPVAHFLKNFEEEAEPLSFEIPQDRNSNSNERRVLTALELLALAGQPQFQNLQVSRDLLAQTGGWAQTLRDPEAAKLALTLVVFHSQNNFQESLDWIKMQSSSENFENLRKLIVQNEKIRTIIFQLALGTLQSLSSQDKKLLLDAMRQSFLQDGQFSLIETLLLFNAEKVLGTLPPAQKTKITVFLAMEELQKGLQNPASVDQSRFTEVLVSLNFQPMARKKEILRKLGEQASPMQKEEFRLLGMALQIPISLF